MSVNTSLLDAFLSDKRRALCLPGLAITIVQYGRIVYQRGLGNAGPSRAMTPQTPMIIGSLSKSFTALAVMQLVEAGKLVLDDPVQYHVPWFCLADADAAASITVRHLLTHTSGISRYAGRALLGGHSGKTIEQSMRGLHNLRLSLPIGTFQYSNTNYLILGLIVEVVSGQAFGTYVQQHIFGPLGMLNSYIREDSALRGGLASGHRWWFGVPLPYKAPYLEDAVPAAFIASSAEDMGRHMLALLNGGDLDDTSVLSPDGVAELHRPQTATVSPGSRYALGWRVEKLGDTEIIRHGGEVSNFLAEMVLIPGQQLGVVVLMNVSNGVAPLALGKDIRLASSVAQLLLGMPQPHRRLSFQSFYALLDLALGILSVYQIWSLVRLLRSSSRTLGQISIFEVLLGIVAAIRIPRLADSPWSLLRIYVPDITSWLAAFFGCSLLKCCVYLFRHLSRRV